MIRRAQLADIDRLAEIHTRALPGDLLPRLGMDFLRKTFYPIVITSRNALTLVSEDASGVQACVVFAYSSGALAREIKARRMRIAVSALRALFRHVGIIEQIRTFMTAKVVLEHKIEDLENLPELYSVATDPAVQSQGHGRSLVREGLRQVSSSRRAGCVVRTSSPRAREFYLMLGFNDIGYEVRGRRKLRILFHPEIPWAVS